MDQQPLNVESIIQRLLEVRGSRPGKNVQLTDSEIRGLCLKSREIFLSQPILLDLEGSLKVLGDIHGQYYDLLRLFEFGGFPPESNYLFLGNYVDFGKQSLETICLLLAYKIKYPENFFLLRGNHECASVNKEHGFYDECRRRYNIRLWKTFNDCFNCLPVVAIIDEKIFCCHGGLSPDLQSMEQIRRIMRPTDVPDQGLLCDLMWADPTVETLGWGENDSGVSFTFGTEIVSKFLTKHNLDLICRGNQVVEDGYEFLAKRRFVTLFSAPNFRGEYDNAGAIMSIDETRMCSFQILKPQDKKAKLGRGEDQKGEQALHEQLEAKLNLMAAQLSEAQQKLNEEQKLSGHLRAECNQHLKDLGHTREELDGVRKELDGVRKELVDIKKEHSTCKTSWIVPRHNVTLLQKSLGGGAWGYVVEGQFRGQQVAVKSIHEAIITEQHVLKRVYREICTMAQMSHPNLVQFIAAVLDDQGGPMIITELLDTTLRKAYKDSLLNMAQCIDLFRDVASALSYLHELEAPIIHRDVSTTNVLLKVVARDKWIAKLSDFGSANWARQACTMGEGAIVYTAPEAFPTHPSLGVKPQPQTTKIDVYSYGILVCEVTLREFPDPDHLREMKEKMKTKHVLLHTLVMKCTEPMPDKRPTMAAVLKELEAIRRKL